MKSKIQKFCVLLVFFSVFIAQFEVYAVSKLNKDSEIVSESVITDKKILDHLTKNGFIEVPDGYKLEKIIITDKNYSKINENTEFSKYYYKDSLLNSTSLFFLNYKISNFKKDNYQITYPNSPIRVSMYEGPSNSTMEISETISNEVSSNTGISIKMIEAKVGHSATYSRTFRDSYSISVPKGKKIRVKAFALYDQWRMDIYMNNNYIGEEFFHKPTGIKFTQEVFTLK